MFILARLVEEVWEKIQKSKTDETEELEAQWTSPDEIENGLGLFSREHLKYVMARGCEERNEGLTAQNRPIGWWTNKSRHNEARQLHAFKFKLRANHVPPEVAGQGEFPIGVMLSNLRSQVTDVTDDFWNAMKTVAYEHVRFDYLLLYRLLYNHISITCGEQQVIITPNKLRRAMETIGICGSNLTCFWDDPEKCQNHLKNHLCKRGFSISYMAYFKERYEGEVPSDRKRSAKKAMIGVSLAELIQMFDNSPTNTAIDMPFLTDSIVSHYHRQEHLQKLNQDGSGFSNLAETMRHCCEFGIISMSMLQKLQRFRLKWNQNRQRFKNDRVYGFPSNDCLMSNVRLLESAGFQQTAQFQMSMKRGGHN